MAEEKKEEAKEAAKGAADGAAEVPVTEESQESQSSQKSQESRETAEKAEAPAAAKPAEPDWKDQYARLLADFDNYKKRAARDREDTYRYAEADILKDVLPSVDNLALALANAANGDDPFVKGVQLVYDTLLKAFKDHGAEPFDCVGKTLDPNVMEAIATLPSPDYDEGVVSTEVKRGWMLKEKLLRAAQVVVSSGRPAAPAAEAGDEKADAPAADAK